MKSLEEVNKNLAEFMNDGHVICNIQGSVFMVHEDSSICDEDYLRKPYTSSLDAQISVFEKLKERGVWINSMGNRLHYSFGLFADKCPEEYTPFSPYNFYEGEGATLPEASARALDAAIDELKK